MLNLGIDPSTKRNLVIDENNRWVGTFPLNISDSLVTRQELPKSQISGQLPAIPLKGIDSSKPAMPQSESKPTMPQSESMHPSESKPYHYESDQSDVVGIVKEQRSALEKLEKQLRIERSERKMLFEQLRVERSARERLEEQLRIERSARERLEEQFKAWQTKPSTLKEKEEEGTSFSDKSGTSQPTELWTQALNKGKINSTSAQRSNGYAVPQDEGLEPSNRVDKKKDGEIKHHPLAREPPY